MLNFMPIVYMTNLHAQHDKSNSAKTYKIFKTIFAMKNYLVTLPVKLRKSFPRTSSIVQVIFSFWSFEISEDILRNQKLIIGLDSFSNQCLIYLIPFR